MQRATRRARSSGPDVRPAPMRELDSEQRRILEELRDALARTGGVAAVCLGGSHARGRARPDSDVDLGVFYTEGEPLDLPALRALCEHWNDTPGPVVTEPFAWGPWVNGGAWLTVRGRRFDLLYRSLEQVAAVVRDAREGRYEIHFSQQPPYGFFGPTYLGELSVAIPLFDPRGRLAELRKCVVPYPEALGRAVVQDMLWAIDFGLAAFAHKLAARGDVYGTVGCLTRFVHQLVLALFALNRRYLVNEKTALDEIEGFERVPPHFHSRVEGLLAAPGRRAEELEATVRALEALFRETRRLAGDAYRPRFSALPIGARGT